MSRTLSSAIPIRSATQHSKSRLVLVDAVRGAAIAGVVLFHLVWDMDFAGLIPAGIANQWAWILFGRLLAGTFMFLVGVSLMLAHSVAIRRRAFVRRIAVIALAAAAITAVTWFVFPEAFVFFGILHAIVAASLIGLVFLNLPASATLVCAIAFLALPHAVSFSLFDSRWLAWTGFAMRPPASVDLVTVFPWVGATLLGLWAAKLAMGLSLDDWLRDHQPAGSFVQVLTLLGRYSLVIYLAHQPILLVIIMAIAL